jgi:TraY domain
MTEDEQAKRQISVAVDPQLRQQLEAAAKRAERSVSGEAAFRLRQSFEAETASAA